MPKVKIDYSNTVFYKIYCKDTNVNELYIGHTTNFVQRKHAHKQSCSNLKSPTYKCKLYNVIREYNGWDNWNMEMIAFHNCNNLYEAKKYEQQYFEDLKATLNSIEPLSKPKPKIIKDIVKKEKPIIFCKLCNVTFQSLKEQDTHNKTKKHIRNTNRMNLSHKIPKNYECNNCNYNTSNYKDYKKHLSTRKHINKTNIEQNELENPIKSPVKFICDCGKEYGARNSLWYHKKKCSLNDVTQESKISNTSNKIDKDLLIKTLLTNKDIMEKIIEIIPDCLSNNK
jgi:hypothetical protein